MPYILYVGRLEQYKNVHMLISGYAASGLSNQFRLVICGDGPERSHLEHAAADAGLANRVLFLGHRSDAWSWINHASMFVSPSLHEGEPNTVLEALACGVPLALSDIEAHRELGIGLPIQFFDPSSVHQTAAALTQVDELSSVTSGELYSVALLDDRSPRSIAERYELVYAAATRHRDL